MLFTIFIQLLFSFLSTAAFAVLNNIPRKFLLACGVTGSAGWMVFWCASFFDGNEAFNSLLGTLTISVLSYIFSRKFKMPVTIITIPAMVPLVPGGLAYEAVRNLAIGNYRLAASSFVQALMIAGAIALGLVLSEILNHNIRQFREKQDKNIFYNR